MTDTTEQTGDYQYGAHAADALKTYQEARAARDKAYNEAVALRNAKCREAEKSVRDLTEIVRDELGCYSEEGEAFVNLFRALTRDKRNAAHDTAERAYKAMIDSAESAIDKAKADRDAAFKADPFTNYLVTVVSRDYASQVETLIGAMPLTMEDMKDLADHHGWCTSFEQVMARAAEKGLLHEDDVKRTEVKRRVAGWDIEFVPAKYGAQEGAGEIWDATVQVPNYMRPDMYNIWELIKYSGGEEYATFVRIYPEPKQQEQAADTDS